MGLLVLGIAIWGFFHLFPAPAPATARAGDEIVVRVYAAQVSDMYGYQFDLYYDKADYTYTGVLTSSIPGFQTIFAKEFDDYLRVGATKTGNEEGFSGRKAEVCDVVLTANRDGELADITIDGVNIVSSELDYLEGITDWSYSIQVNAR